MSMAFILIYLGIALVALVGWLVPLILGISSLRKQRSTVGWVLTGLGGLWALSAVAALTIGFVFTQRLQRDLTPVDFNPQTYSGKTISLQVGDLGEGYLESYEEKRLYRYKPVKGVVTMPADVMPVRCVVARRDDKVLWEADTVLTSSRPKEPPTSTGLKVGPPFTTTIIARASSGKVTMRLETKDRGGNFTTIRSTQEGQPPSFEARDAKGNLVWSGRFSYG